MQKLPQGSHGPMKNGRPMVWQDLTEVESPSGAKLTKAQAKKFLREQADQEMWQNDLYNCQIVSQKVNKQMDNLLITELAITRRDRKPIHDWRHMQQIKNDILGGDVEALELYPSESRLLDTANTYWLYAFPKGVTIPLGQMFRNVSGDDKASVVGAVQRPFK